MRTMKTLALAAFAASALALAGCGGGGSSAVTQPPGTGGGTTPKDVSLTGLTATGLTATPADGQKLAAGGTADNGNITFTCASDAGAGGCTLMVSADGKVSYTGGAVTAAYKVETVDLAGLTKGYTTLAATTTPLSIAAGASVDHGDAKFTCPAGDADCSVTVAADGTVTSTGAKVTVSDSQAFTTRLAAAKNAATKAALTKETAIGTEAAQTTDDGPGGSAATNDHTIAIERTSSGTTVTIAVVGAATTDPKFVQTDLGSGRTKHVRTMNADTNGNVVRETMIVGTDIKEPTPTAFAKVTGQALNARDLDPAVDDDGDGTDDNDFTALTVANNATVRALVMSDAFTAGTQATLTFDSDDTSTDNKDEAFETAGTYNGATGTYRCNGSSDCTVSLDGQGAITEISGGWVFTPAAGATSDVPDTAYLYYGFWLKSTTDKGGAVTYNEVETFAQTGAGLPASGDVTAVSGIATYSGDAVGAYVHKTFATDGTADATSGDFTADVSLTAYFSGGETPADKADTLTGTISNFMLSGGEANSWSVTLQSDGDTNTAGIQPDPDGAMAGTAKGGVTGQDGSFSATFYGSVADDGDTTTPIPQPGAVVGEFNSVFSNGSVAGAYGARRQ